jgi:hypothetical protein
MMLTFEVASNSFSKDETSENITVNFLSVGYFVLYILRKMSLVPAISGIDIFT